ncbi:hypothetical protein QAD02_013696 [Eretmocerus hayati]|uniref:Uncharacterized protein n=1 Tax=Eretmocerus hayati TaxID=131215 RepID=A0ACC2P3L4_9HYME|nr:hypothetical protein QAD02_013696 [Eretmocerus hayati]
MATALLTVARKVRAEVLYQALRLPLNESPDEALMQILLVEVDGEVLMDKRFTEVPYYWKLGLHIKGVAGEQIQEARKRSVRAEAVYEALRLPLNESPDEALMQVPLAEADGEILMYKCLTEVP